MSDMDEKDRDSSFLQQIWRMITTVLYEWIREEDPDEKTLLPGKKDAVSSSVSGSCSSSSAMLPESAAGSGVEEIFTGDSSFYFPPAAEKTLQKTFSRESGAGYRRTDQSVGPDVSGPVSDPGSLPDTGSGSRDHTLSADRSSGNIHKETASNTEHVNVVYPIPAEGSISSNPAVLSVPSVSLSADAVPIPASSSGTFADMIAGPDVSGPVSDPEAWFHSGGSMSFSDHTSSGQNVLSVKWNDPFESEVSSQNRKMIYPAAEQETVYSVTGPQIPGSDTWYSPAVGEAQYEAGEKTFDEERYFQDVLPGLQNSMTVDPRMFSSQEISVPAAGSFPGILSIPMTDLFYRQDGSGNPAWKKMEEENSSLVSNEREKDLPGRDFIQDMTPDLFAEEMKKDSAREEDTLSLYEQALLHLSQTSLQSGGGTSPGDTMDGGFSAFRNMDPSGSGNDPVSSGIVPDLFPDISVAEPPVGQLSEHIRSAGSSLLAEYRSSIPEGNLISGPGHESSGELLAERMKESVKLLNKINSCCENLKQIVNEGMNI